MSNILLYKFKVEKSIPNNFAICLALMLFPPILFSLNKQFQLFWFIFPISFFASIIYLIRGLKIAIKERTTFVRFLVISWSASTFFLVALNFPIAWMIVMAIASGGQMVVLSK